MTKTISVNATGSGTVGVEIDGVLVASSVSISTGLNVLKSGVSLSQGQHTILIFAPGFQTITAMTNLVFS
jgi:hypothetical protein